MSEFLGDYQGRVFSEPTLELGRQFQYDTLNQLSSYLPIFNRQAGEAGDSREFQRALYRTMTRQEPPESYSGFHASQADRITNVFNPEEVDVEAMREIAFIATAMREMQNAGFSSFDNLRSLRMYEDTWNAPQPVSPQMGGQSRGGGGGGLGGIRDAGEMAPQQYGPALPPGGDSQDMNQLFELLNRMPPR